jgi:hypothetical protein
LKRFQLFHGKFIKNFIRTEEKQRELNMTLHVAERRQYAKEAGEDSIINTVALCPNYNRKMHIRAKEEEMKRFIPRAVTKGEIT